ncbi:hypothetical protein KC727_01180 [Candidatus Kaiserbacteria bacterium]|nr:hypothetical protein [Candidatus Kaiserbacteria bacterium]
MNNRYPTQQKNRGAALLTFVILFLLTSAAFVFAVTRGVYFDLTRYRTLETSKQTFFGVESAIEDAIHRHRNSKDYDVSESFTIGDTDLTVSRAIVSGHFEFDIVGTTNTLVRKGYLEFTIGAGTSFSYGLQSDTGGILLENSSSVLGNIYSNGTVVGTGGGPDGNDVFGTVISAGASGYVEGIHATGNVYAHGIDDAVIDGNAYCDAIDGSTVSGNLLCNTVTATSPNPADGPGPADDQPPSDLPLTDEDIDDIKAAAEAGGVIASTDPECSGGTYSIDASTTIGPVKIECDVEVRNSGTVVTLEGQVWIEGDLIIGIGQPEIAISSSLEGETLTIVADDESNRTTSSKVDLGNKATFSGYGDNSYIILVSQNNDEEMGGSEIAINSGQSSVGDVLLHAAHGEIVISQSGEFVGVAARLIRLQNSAQIIYQTGAISLLFPDGPGGGYIINEWSEVE